jgi:hypothetical protein
VSGRNVCAGLRGRVSDRFSVWAPATAHDSPADRLRKDCRAEMVPLQARARAVRAIAALCASRLSVRQGTVESGAVTVLGSAIKLVPTASRGRTPLQKAQMGFLYAQAKCSGGNARAQSKTNLSSKTVSPSVRQAEARGKQTRGRELELTELPRARLRERAQDRVLA